jgi:hypothetical protein
MKKIAALSFMIVFVMILFKSCGDVHVFQFTKEPIDDVAENPDAGCDDCEENDNNEVPDWNEIPDQSEVPDKEIPDDPECNELNIGKACATDKECGECNICEGGKCVKGCFDDDDCTMYSNLKCNRKLGRCLNTVGSNSACSEENCPDGCCFAKRGLQELQCSSEPHVSICGLCQQGDIYEGARCIPAICDVVADSCPHLNAFERYPQCWECRKGEMICYEKVVPGASGCENMTIQVSKCISSGGACKHGGAVSCCSGMPCINGFCY